MNVRWIVRSSDTPFRHVGEHRNWTREYSEAKPFPTENACHAYMRANPVDINWQVLPIPKG